FISTRRLLAADRVDTRLHADQKLLDRGLHVLCFNLLERDWKLFIEQRICRFRTRLRLLQCHTSSTTAPPRYTTGVRTNSLLNYSSGPTRHGTPCRGRRTSLVLHDTPRLSRMPPSSSRRHSREPLAGNACPFGLATVRLPAGY